jgi:hypothetical protein
MNDVEIINKQISMLTDRLDRCIARIEELKQDRQRLGYELHVNENHAVEAQLKKSRDELAGLTEQLETLAGAVAELQKRKVAAQAAVARDAATEHRAKARALIKTLVEEVAPKLDETRPHPDGDGPYHYSDPPTVSRAATLIAALLVELRALGQDHGADFMHSARGSNSRWDLLNKEDMRRELVKMLQAGWRYVPSAERRPVTPGRRQPSALPFIKMFGFWAQRLDSVLREQSNEKERAA